MRVERHPSWEPWWFSSFDDYPPKPKRKRRPTVASVLAQSRRAGVSIGSFTVNKDGSISIVPGTPVVTREPTMSDPGALDGSEWD